MGSPDPPGFRTLKIAKSFRFPCKILFQRLSSEGHTRSHPEHGSQASDRRWYLVLGSGRVGRRWIHAPHEVNLVGGFFVLSVPPCGYTLAIAACQYIPLAAHSRPPFSPSSPRRRGSVQEEAALSSVVHLSLLTFTGSFNPCGLSG